MQVSLESRFYMATCGLISIYNAYSNPVQWITFFVLGVLAGTWQGHKHLNAAINLCRPEQSYCTEKERQAKKIAIHALASSMPGLFTAAINLFALGMISKCIQFPVSNMDHYIIEMCSSSLGPFILGIEVGFIFQLEKLCKSTDPFIKEFLDKTHI